MIADTKGLEVSSDEVAPHAQADGASDRDREEPGGGAVRRQRIGRVPVPVGEPAVASGFRRSQARHRRGPTTSGAIPISTPAASTRSSAWRTASRFSTSPIRQRPSRSARRPGQPRRGATSRSTSCSTPAAQRWRAFAYVMADNVPDPLMVLDLSGLPNGVERVNFTSDHRSAHTNYMTNADLTYGIAQTSETPLLAHRRRQSQRRQPSAVLARPIRARRR